MIFWLPYRIYKGHLRTLNGKILDICAMFVPKPSYDRKSALLWWMDMRLACPFFKFLSIVLRTFRSCLSDLPCRGSCFPFTGRGCGWVSAICGIQWMQWIISLCLILTENSCLAIHDVSSIFFEGWWTTTYLWGFPLSLSVIPGISVRALAVTRGPPDLILCVLTISLGAIGRLVYGYGWFFFRFFVLTLGTGSCDFGVFESLDWWTGTVAVEFTELARGVGGDEEMANAFESLRGRE